MKIVIKLSLIVCAFCFSSNINPPKSIYSIPLKDIDGNSAGLMPYRGKKMMVLVISGQEKDSALLNQLASFCERYKDSIAVIAVPSIEDGYSADNKANVKRLFSERNLQVLLLEGCYTRKTTGENQGELMQWCTTKTQNMMLDRDIMGPGHRFFIDDMGGMQYGAMPFVSYSAPFIQRFMSWPVLPYPGVPEKKTGTQLNAGDSLI
jgi:glutathione peroxidase-family protein